MTVRMRPADTTAVEETVRDSRARTPVRTVLVRRGDVTRSGASLTIGSADGNDVVIDDPGVSRKHIEIRVEEAQDLGGAPRITVLDLGSTNGVLVNGKRVERAALADGATIKIGNTTMSLHLKQG